MTRLERLLSVGLLLSARRRLRAEDLAEQFGVSLRTVYRDMQALQDAGFPVVGTAGADIVCRQQRNSDPWRFRRTRPKL